MADVANAFYVSDGVIYEIRAKVQDFEEAVVVKTADSATIAVGTVLNKYQWFVILDSARFVAIKQKDNEIKALQREIDDLEHIASRGPGRINEGTLRDKKETLASLILLVDNMKYKGPIMVRFLVSK
jgi:hypothetical protein